MHILMTERSYTPSIAAIMEGRVVMNLGKRKYQDSSFMLSGREPYRAEGPIGKGFAIAFIFADL